jgi:hypothetical protein
MGLTALGLMGLGVA